MVFAGNSFGLENYDFSLCLVAVAALVELAAFATLTELVDVKASPCGST